MLGNVNLSKTSLLELNPKGHRLVTSRNSGSRVKSVNSLFTICDILDSAPSCFVQVLLLLDCRFFQRESMTKWNSKPLTYTFTLFRYLFSQINDLHKKHNCFRIEIPTFLLVYKKRTNKRPEHLILASDINTANGTFNMECQWSSDLTSRETQHRNN